MGHHAVSRYFLEKRNFLLKEGGLGLRQHATVSINATKCDRRMLRRRSSTFSSVRRTFGLGNTPPEVMHRRRNLAYQAHPLDPAVVAPGDKKLRH